MYNTIAALCLCLLVIPGMAHGYNIMSFDVDWMYYQDANRTFDMDFSQGTQESAGDIDFYNTWSSNSGSGTNPAMNFHPEDGTGSFFTLNAAAGRLMVSIPKPIDRLPAMTAADTIDWDAAAAYIDEGPEIDFRGGSASANIETVKLAYNADKSRLKLFFEVTEETDLADTGFRFVFFPVGSRGSYDHMSYVEDNYPSGAPGYLIVDLDGITAGGGSVSLSRISASGAKTSISGTPNTCTRTGTTFEVSFGIISGDDAIVDLATEDFLMEGVSFSDPDGSPQLQDSFAPQFLYSRAGGEFTVTAGDAFDGQGATTEYLMSARLDDFDAFLSDSLNEFRIGMFNNAVSGYNDAPQVSVSGKWVSGFYNGKRYDSSFLFESRVFDNENTVQGVWLTEEPVEVEDVAPETAVIDVAMQSSDSGRRIDLYYRISTVDDAPSRLAPLDSTWTHFNRFTITSARPFYGYPVNKTVVHVAADAIAYPVEMPAWGNAGNNAEVVDSDMQTESATDLERQYHLSGFMPLAPTQRVELTCDPAEKVVLRYLINGAQKALNQLRLYKLKRGNHLSFGDYAAHPTPGTIASGDWWITELGASPDEALDRLGELEKGERYVLYFVVQDNDGMFDLDETQGRILDPTVIGDDSGTITADDTAEAGSGGGCFLSVMGDR